MMEGMARIEPGPGWSGFTDPALYLQFAVILVASTLSSALLAYHPVYRGRPTTLPDLDLRKTLIIYGNVGALIAVVVTVSPAMAFVIFGIGGLMRFRTDVGASKDTGHTIMATLVGLCWGLSLELVAVLATVYFWGLIFALERRPALEITVGGVPIPEMSAAASAYRDAIARAGGRLLSHDKDFKRTQMTFVLHTPRGAAVEKLSREIAAIPDALRGTPNWHA